MRNSIIIILILCLSSWAIALTIYPQHPVENERIELILQNDNDGFLDINIKIFEIDNKESLNKTLSFHKINHILENQSFRSGVTSVGIFTGALFLGPILALGYTGAHFSMDDNGREKVGEYIFGDNEVRKVQRYINLAKEEYDGIQDGEPAYEPIYLYKDKYSGDSFSKTVQNFLLFLAYYQNSREYNAELNMVTCEGLNPLLDSEDFATCNPGVQINYK